MKTTTLRELIRESIQGYIREIDMVSEIAAIESKIAEAQNAIEERKAKLTKADELNESGLIDEKIVKKVKDEVAKLEKYKAKQEALLEKKKAKNKGKGKEVDDEMITEEPMEMDEIDGLEEVAMSSSKLKARYLTSYEDFDDADFEFYDDKGNTLSGYGQLDDEWFNFDSTGIHNPEIINKLESTFGNDISVIGPSTSVDGEEGVYTINIDTKAPNFLSKIEFEGGKSWRNDDSIEEAKKDKMDAFIFSFYAHDDQTGEKDNMDVTIKAETKEEAEKIFNKRHPNVKKYEVEKEGEVKEEFLSESFLRMQKLAGIIKG